MLPSNPSDIPTAVAAAREADVVVLYIGGKAGWYSDDLTEGEGKDTANIDLPPQQVELVNAVADLGKPTVAVVSFGRPQGLVPVIDRLPAVLTAYYGGPHQGSRSRLEGEDERRPDEGRTAPRGRQVRDDPLR